MIFAVVEESADGLSWCDELIDEVLMNTMRGLITICAAAILIPAAGSAHADMTVIDFESLGDLTVVDNQFLGLGADFNGLAKILSRSSGTLASSWPSPYSGDKVISDFSYDPVSDSIIDIRVDAVGAEWLMAGGYVTGTGNVTLTAYDSWGFPLGTPSSTGGANLGGDPGLPPNMFLSVSAANIAYVIFSNDHYDICTVDDFTFNPVPVPAAVLLGVLGLGVAGWKLRKFE